MLVRNQVGVCRKPLGPFLNSLLKELGSDAYRATVGIDNSQTQTEPDVSVNFKRVSPHSYRVCGRWSLGADEDEVTRR